MDFNAAMTKWGAGDPAGAAAALARLDMVGRMQKEKGGGEDMMVTEYEQIV